MSARPLILIGISILFVPYTVQECQDLVNFCDSLSPICAGSIIQYHIEQLAAVANQIENKSAIPSLEKQLPKVESGLPLVGTTGESKESGDVLQSSLPFLKESLPIIRESLPLIRESLPLIRQFVDPLFNQGDKSTCQKKAICKSCRECPKLRESIVSLVESMCPKTCKVCNKVHSPNESAEQLVQYYM